MIQLIHKNLLMLGVLTFLGVHLSFAADSNSIDPTPPSFTVAADGKTCLCPDASDGDSGIVSIGGQDKTFTKRNRTQLLALINTDPTNPEIALTCTSGITNMTDLFRNKSTFNQDLSGWDVSDVTDMRRMFQNSGFNQDISNWDVSNVTNMNQMFRGTPFNQPLGDWDVTNVTRMHLMFKQAASFNQDIGNWQVQNVENMREMFSSATSFNQDISSWDVSSVTNMVRMFRGATVFNQDLSNWCVSQIPVEPTDFALNSALTNPNLPNWGVPCAGDANPNFTLGADGKTCLCPDAADGESGPLTINGTEKTFTKRSLAQLQSLISTNINDPEIALTCTSGITNMQDLFNGKDTFNQDLSSWDVSNVTNMRRLFFRANAFDQDISNWDVSSVTDMNQMFRQAFIFNQDIGDWDVLNVTNMKFMFRQAFQFNQDIGDWDVSSATNMDGMFQQATVFNQDLTDWCVEQIASEPTEFSQSSALTSGNAPDWGAACEDLANPNFVLAADGMTCLCPFANDGETGVLTINGVNKIFTKRSLAELQTIIANNANDSQIALTCTSGITDMQELFKDKTTFNLDLSAWDVSSVTNMRSMFQNTAFDHNISHWDVSDVTNMRFMFSNTPFNHAIGDWDVSSVTDMNFMFLESQLFNQDIGLWNVTNVTTMTDMFGQATMFNQDISAWNVENVTNMDRMFRLAAAFNQDLSNWCVEQIENEPSQFAEDTFENGNRPNWGASCDGTGNPNFTLAADGKTCLCPDATDGETGILLVNGINQVFTKRNLTQLKALRDNDPNDPEIALTCTSGITNMENLFNGQNGFNQDLSSWDVSNVTTMRRMFQNSGFDQDISNWDVSNVTNMSQLFRGTPFNQAIGDWDVSSVTNMQLMFKQASDFNQDIDDWTTVSVTNMREMFDQASSFNQDVSGWEVENVTNMSGMFRNASIFDQDLSLWCVEQIASAPTDFATGSPLNSSPSNHPDWGATCATDIVYTTANGFQPVDPNNDTAVTYNLDVQDGTAVITAALTFGSITVRPGAVIDLDEDIIVIDEMLFESDASGSGQIADMTGVTITGDVRVQRYIPAKRAFRFLSSAVGGQSFADSWQQDTHITGAQGIVGQTSPEGLDYTNSGFASLFTYDVQNDDWAAVLNTKTTNLEVGTGYRLFVRGDRTIDLNDNNAPATVTTLEARGNLMVGDLTTGTDLPALSSMPSKFSLVGNPYQAVVDFSATDRTNLTDFIYVWDASIAGDNGNGGYVTVPLGVGPQAPSASDATKYLAPGQAIFVENTAAGNASIVFSESDKAVEEAQVTVFDTYADFFINSRLFSTSNYQNNDRESDAISIRFNQSYTTIASSGEDSGKLPNPGENYAVLNNGYRAIDNQNIPVDGHQIDLSIWNYQELDYTLTFSYENQPSNLKVYLHDTYLNTQIELTGNDVYSFTADSNLPGSVAPTRFHLSFENQTLSNTDFALSGISLYPNPVQGELNINLPSGIEISTVKVFNTLGQQVQSTTRSQVDMSGLTSGVYFVEITTNKGQHTQKVIKD